MPTESSQLLRSKNDRPKRRVLSRDLSYKNFFEDNDDVPFLAASSIKGRNTVADKRRASRKETQPQVGAVRGSFPATDRKSQMSKKTLHSIDTTPDGRARQEWSSPSSALNRYFNLKSEQTIQSIAKQDLKVKKRQSSEGRSSQNVKKSCKKRQTPSPLIEKLKNGLELNINMGQKIRIELDQNLRVRSQQVIQKQEQQVQENQRPSTYR